MTNSLDRALAMLELVNRAPGGLTNSEISRRLRMATSTCSYITGKLHRRGYLSRNPDTRRFTVGLPAVALAHGALRELGFRSTSEPVLYRLATETGLSAGIGVLERGRVLCVDRVEAPSFVQAAAQHSPDWLLRQTARRGRSRDQRDIGREMPTHTTALGKTLLAFLPEEELMRLLRTLVLRRSTPKTIVSTDALLEQLAAIRECGYAIAEEEEYAGVRALAGPIFGSGRRIIAALALNGSVHAPVWKHQGALIRAIEEASLEIARRAAHR